MMSQKIEQLTPEQEALIPVYWEKWKRIIFSTEPINCQKATAVVKAAYNAIDLEEPKILFFDSPYLAWKHILLNTYLHEYIEIIDLLESKLIKPISINLANEIRHNLLRETSPNFWSLITIESHIVEAVNHKTINLLEKEESIFYNNYVPKGSENFYSNIGRLDYFISVLGCSCHQDRWQVLQQLIKNCGWIFPFEEVCYVCDRPRVLSFDNEQRLHAEGTPAIQFADGFSVYAYHGVELPEKYGVLHPNQWHAQWLLEEDNAELRRVLIQGIGYSRICQELQATELDFWQEYTLLKIDNDVDVEPIYLLKMTCPSTGFIHALRVPPDVKSAREAIRWVNWGIDPEKFSVQT
ncbi:MULTISPECIES: DUF6745 domain-containing protein [Cyanophyceae]|uniref:DUF6745 domain-containing protein n=1 Tax=Cyanophyceae TaxID=3028117 RepID=UPI001682744B|nr:hypothetical protein [Trichocoleus sp. FACHB-40]MBD2002677.1 hypothetical protein [Trichocoleus sp. FACHB-40]